MVDKLKNTDNITFESSPSKSVQTERVHCVMMIFDGFSGTGKTFVCKKTVAKLKKC
jgi:uridine kinase